MCFPLTVSIIVMRKKYDPIIKVAQLRNNYIANMKNWMDLNGHYSLELSTRDSF